MTTRNVPDSLRQAILRTLACRVVGDRDGAAIAMDDILEHGTRGLYIACCAWAGTVDLLTLSAGQPGFVSFDIIGPLGLPVEPEDLPADKAPEVWAARFVAAQANEDPAIKLALFTASVENPVLYEGVLLLLDWAAEVIRQQTP